MNLKSIHDYCPLKAFQNNFKNPLNDWHYRVPVLIGLERSCIQMVSSWPQIPLLLSFWGHNGNVASLKDL